jgi:hypothetical protein
LQRLLQNKEYHKYGVGLLCDKRRFGQSCNLIIKIQMVVDQYAKTTSRADRCDGSVGIKNQCRVIEFRQLLGSANNQEFSFSVRPTLAHLKTIRVRHSGGPPFRRSAIPEVRHSGGPPFRRSAIPDTVQYTVPYIETSTTGLI